MANISKNQTMDLIESFQSIVRSYNPQPPEMRGESGFYSYYDEESQQTFFLVTLNIILALYNHNKPQFEEKIEIIEDDMKITYQNGEPTDILIGYSIINYDEEEYDQDKQWCQMTINQLPEDVGYCEKRS